MSDKHEIYIQTVKHNLRSFLYTVNYRIDNYGSFTRDKQFHTLQDLVNQLNNKANKEYNDFRLEKLHEKVKKILSSENLSLDAYFINELAELYHFPLDKIYTNKKISQEKAAIIMNEVNNNKSYDILSKATHASYFTIFHGYSYEHNPHKPNDLLHFTLEFYLNENNEAEAKYCYKNSINEEKTFIGTPYYIASSKSIFIPMHSPDYQHHQFLYFAAVPHNKVIYKHGCCFRTSTASASLEPDIKSFILTSAPLDMDLDKKIIEGLLMLNNHVFYLLKTKLDELCNQNDTIKTLLEKYPSYCHLVDDALYCIQERKILDASLDEHLDDQLVTFEALTMLKSYSLSEKRFSYRVHQADYNFFKQLPLNNQK